MSNKVYGLLVTGDIIEGVENVDNVTTPKSMRAFYRGNMQTIKPVASWPHTQENYDHLVGLFGKQRVPEPDMTTETSRAYLLKHGKAIGKVSDKSVEHARNSSQFLIVELASDDKTFVVGDEAYSYCVLYNSILQEIKPEPQRPALKAGDYVMGVSSDLEGISNCQYLVFDAGQELVVFDDVGDRQPIVEMIDLGHFERIEKE